MSGAPLESAAAGAGHLMWRFSSWQNWRMCCYRYLSGASDIAAGARTGGMQCVNSQTRISDGGGRKDPKGDNIRALVRNRKSCMQNQDKKKKIKNTGR